MTWRWSLVSLCVGALALGGCAAGIAAKAVGLAVQGARGESESNEHLRPTAAQACTDRAAQYGAVRIIDVEQRTLDKIVVWGTAGEGESRRSFQCTFKTKIVGFKLREIKSRS